MKRNIVTTIEFSKGSVSLVAIEKFSSNNVVEIFSAKGAIKLTKDFLSESLDKIKKMVGGPVKHVNVVLEMGPNIDANVTLKKLEYRIPGKEITKQDIDNALELAKKESLTNNSTPILIQPIRFDVKGVDTKSYVKAPLHKTGNLFIVLCSVTTISNETFGFVSSIAKELKVEINQILLEPQSISQNRLSENALSSGSVLLHVSKNQSFVTVTKNMAVVGLLPIYNMGLKALVNGISKRFMCTVEKARDLFWAHGTFDETKDGRNIFSRQVGLKEELYTSGHLRNIMTQYMQNMMMQIVPWLKQKNIVNLPLVISGEISRLAKVNTFIENCFPELLVSIYNPISYVELNEKNAGCLGMINFIESMDKILGKQYNNVVETIPNALSSLSLKDRLRLYSKTKLRAGASREH